MKRPVDNVSRRDFLHATAGTAAGLGLGGMLAQNLVASESTPRPTAQKSAFGLHFPPLEKVRIGFIGVGGRGSGVLGNLLDIPNVEIKALCDIVPERVKRNQRRVVERGQPEPAGYTKGDTDFEHLCRRDDLDAVYIATPWQWHTPMAVSAMENGHHAFTEVPAAVTLDECWKLVDTAERTGRHCMMLENCCYGEVELLLLNMVRLGLFGQLTHGEAAYLHDLRGVLYDENGEGKWRRNFHTLYNGNLYPTHGLGPVAQYMGIHGGDKFEYLVSMSSLEHSLSRRRDALGPTDARRHEKFVCGDMNVTLIKTALGRTIMVQHDVTTPRPYSRINAICGTKGSFRDYPPRIHLDGQPENWDQNLGPYYAKYSHPLWKAIKQKALHSGGHGGMDYVLNWHLMRCLQTGRPLDMTVYDAAAWSAIFPLSVASVRDGSVPVAVPDFTRGQWKTQSPLGIVEA